MNRASLTPVGSRLALFGPPYERFTPIDISWEPPPPPPRGLALVWWLEDGELQQEQFQWLADRPWGLPLFIILPPPTNIERALPLLSYINSLSPRAVLPGGPLVTPLHLRRMLRTPPRQLGATVTSYLTRRQLLVQDDIRRGVRKIFESIPEVTSVSKLARRLYTSRRTMGRHFAAAGLPVPSHWLQFARLLMASFRLQDDRYTVARVATRLGYPDGFTLSNQMKRLLDCRPSDVRRHLGWEWIIEMWLRTETGTGGIDRVRYREVIAVYCGDEELPA